MTTLRPDYERYISHHAKPPKQSKIQKALKRPIHSYKKPTGFFYLIFNHVTILPLLAFLSRVVFKFFLPQYFQKIHLTHVPVKHVDHQLDEKVNFNTDHFDTYMGFITYFVRPQLVFCTRYGYIKGAVYPKEFLKYLAPVYDECYRLYKYSYTTTFRPENGEKRIKKLHKGDPHFMCIPSLHIAIVCLTTGYFKMCFEREGFTEEEKKLWLTELYDEGIAIAESVLYLKQHSVNCIPAAMYLITHMYPEIFPIEDAIALIDKLFENAPDINQEDKESIKEHIKFTYERFLLEATTAEDWREPVIRWLDSYENFIPFYANKNE